jgi:(E)-4-hydroxy-3-methylbut-2-enyl-diphosphate synthase
MIKMQIKMYNKSLVSYFRRNSKTVNIGGIELGGENPVRIQSMTNTKTSDVDATVEQCISLYKSGSEYIRITAPTFKDAELLSEIKSKLKDKGINVPLVADIHFSPKAAETAAGIVDKVRVNPGNYIDKKRFEHFEYTNEEYTNEIDKIKENFVPLINICKKNKVAIRIGSNHGSLSDRIMSKYGDTPLGMVESTMEFLRICVSENFFDVVISMKASNPIVMIHATRLLVKTMNDEGMNFPIHLGVTEAGNYDEGRIKSAIGISSLLADGIGDTIRVSLTEKPENELPVAKLLSDMKFEVDSNLFQNSQLPEIGIFDFIKRKTFAVKNIGGDNLPVVIADYSEENNIVNKNTLFADFIFVEEKILPNINSGSPIIVKFDNYKSIENTYPYFSYTEYNDSNNKSDELNFVEADESFVNDLQLSKLSSDQKTVFILNLNKTKSPLHFARQVFYLLLHNKIENPVVLKYENNNNGDKFLVETASSTGTVFIDGFGNGVYLKSKSENNKKIVNTSYSILQACRARTSKTEYISCPSCGRTLFDLEETTAKIKEKTQEFVGLKIGIMGCIVNGPGEMADADYGYVGSLPGKINLYKGKEVVKRNIPENEAVEELLMLIKKDK